MTAVTMLTMLNACTQHLKADATYSVGVGPDEPFTSIICCWIRLLDNISTRDTTFTSKYCSLWTSPLGTSAQQHLGKAGNSTFLSVTRRQVFFFSFFFSEYFRGMSRMLNPQSMTKRQESDSKVVLVSPVAMGVNPSAPGIKHSRNCSPGIL